MQTFENTTSSDHAADGHIAETACELEELLKKIRRVDFVKHGEALRPGFHPVVSIPTDAAELQRGGMNVHIPVTFSDGTRWLARVRQQSANQNSVAVRMRHAIIQSEIATMQVLKRAKARIPNAFLPNQVEEDIDFFFIEFFEGTSCRSPIAQGPLNEQQLLNVINSLASFYIHLSDLRFSNVGSLVHDKSTDTYHVGPLISLDFCQDDPPCFFGPFESSAHKYLAHIEHVLSQIERGRAFIDNAAEVYATHLWLKDLVQTSTLLWEEGPTYIKHADDKGDQIMVDADGNIVGVIDWEWAYTASKSEAFAAPLALTDVASFFDGSNELSMNDQRLAEAYETLGRPDLAECVRAGRVHQRLPMVIGQEPDVVQLLAIQHTLTNTREKEQTFEDWVAKVMEKYKGDAILQKLRGM